MIAIHAVATFMDATGSVCTGAFWFNECHADWPTAVWAYDLGIFGFYLALILGPSYYLRKRLGVRTWKFAHRFTVIFYIAAVWHTFILGIAPQDYLSFTRPLFWLLQIPALLLLARRFYDVIDTNGTPATLSKRAASWTIIAMCGAGAVFILGVVVTNHAGWLCVT